MKFVLGALAEKNFDYIIACGCDELHMAYIVMTPFSYCERG
jgi:hypothetical protein